MPDGSSFTLQLPRPGEPESAMLPGMAAAASQDRVQALAALSPSGGADSSLPGLQALQEPAAWYYDFDPATGVARAYYPGEVNIAGNPVGGPVTGTGAIVLQTSPTINTPTISAPTFTGTSTFNGQLNMSAGQIIAPSQVAGIFGTSGATNAAAGSWGEYVSQTVATPGVTLGNNVAQNVTSISLTAGDWDVYGGVGFGASGATGIGSYLAGIGTTTNGMPTAPTASGANVTSVIATIPNAAGWVLQVAPTRFSLASTTIVYLVAQSGFAGTMTAYGFIAARRAR